MAHLQVPSHPSSSRTSLAQPQSVRSNQSRRHPTVRSIVTSPPWATDEPPSPTSDDDDNHTILGRQSDSNTRPSDVASSYHSSAQPGSATESRWWAFTRGPGEQQHPPASSGEPPTGAAVDTPSPQGSPKLEKRGIMFRERSKAWLPITRRSHDASANSKSPGFDKHRTEHNEDGGPSSWGLTIDLPSPPSAPFTMAQSQTPGWNSPWTPRVPNQPLSEEEEIFGRDSDEGEKTMSRRKKLRVFILTNTFVPLLFRFINITFTASALGVALRIRNIEMRNHITGIVGSSPTLVIIFAPLTIVHVMVAIYLEYFGRPLGLWHTSSKLAHTLLEVLFICAWSAALSLCFDNYFTSLVPCASGGSIRWYSELPRPASPLFGNLGVIGDSICDDQIVLIGLVFVGLIMYCISLNISLFRIFEKVKYHPGTRAGFRSHA
ncbi:hypothetical protein FIBSPDRAFT_945244 [Athelia psychrophila]|uniref:Uncharacterized protein n=1 Tax=Athelia psychrophila TaxID=1759441 RepID=A0A166U1H9_9AGAM|nr:hypothetical protein FIBSPDRAFT_945244 [Fibularhizoctonia sp. CBS 109695]